jgi:hypothetical protein
MTETPKELLRFTREEYNSGDMNLICAQLRERRISFARPGPHWFPTILPPYTMTEDPTTGDVIIAK